MTEENLFEGSDNHEDIDYSDMTAEELVKEMARELQGTELNSVGWSIFKPQWLADLEALHEKVIEEDE